MASEAELTSLVRSSDLSCALCARLLHGECTFALMALAAILDLLAMSLAIKGHLAHLAACKLKHVLGRKCASDKCNGENQCYQ